VARDRARPRPALGYRVWRGYRQPQLILEFRNLRLG
jgi:hypothetical protein